MKIEKVEIHNWRSIAELKIDYAEFKTLRANFT